MHQIQRHIGVAPPDLSLLLEEALDEGFDFVERTRTEWITAENRFDLDREGFWVATISSGVIGMCGINIDPYVGDSMVGRLRHLYVADNYRGNGIGAELVSTVMRFAVGRFHTVQLRTPSALADKFYDEYGFDRSTSENASHEISGAHRFT